MATVIMPDPAPADGFGADKSDSVGPRPGRNSSRPTSLTESGDEEYDELGARPIPRTAAAYVWPM